MRIRRFRRRRRCSSSAPRSRDGSPPTRRRSATATGRAVSAAPAAALLAALAVAALLVDADLVGRARSARVLLVAALRAPAQRRWPYLVGTLTTRAPRRRADAVRRGDRLAPALDRADDPGARHARRDDARSSRNGLFQGLRLAAVGLAFAVYALLLDHDRLLAVRGLGAPLDGRRRARDAARAAARARRARPAGRAARPRRRARRRCGSSRRSSPARSSAASTSPRRWRRAATAAPAGRARRAPPWTVARPRSRSSLAVAIVVVGALWL